MIEYKAIARDGYSMFWKLLNAYYRDGEDVDAERAVLDGQLHTSNSR